MVEILAYQCSDIISYLLKLAQQLLWQMTASIRYEFGSCNSNSLHTDHHSFVYIVVATTRHSRTNDLTTSKALSRLSSNEWGITRELDKEPSLYCSSIYITYKWSVLQQCVYLMSILISYYSSTCVFHKATMLPTCALTSYL